MARAYIQIRLLTEVASILHKVYMQVGCLRAQSMAYQGTSRYCVEMIV